MDSIISSATEMPHIGNLLNNLLIEMKISKAELARMMGCNSVSINGYVNAASLQLRVVWKISKALKYDFFEHISNSLNDNAKTKLAKNSAEQIATMQQQIDDLQKAVVIYRDLLKK